MARYYQVEPSREDRILCAVYRQCLKMLEGGGPRISPDAEQILDFCYADWPEGAEHQHWLDNAPVDEIADWVVVGLLAQDQEV